MSCKRRWSPFLPPTGEPAIRLPGARSIDVGSDDPAAGDRTAPIRRWRTITIGDRESPAALRAALEASGMGIGDMAGAALDRLALAAEPTEIALVVCTGVALGITSDNATLAEIAERAARHGLVLCPAEVGPQLRLQYHDQRVGEHLRIAMVPVETERGAVGFRVGNGGDGLILIGGDGRLEAPVPPVLHFVFARPLGPTAANGSNPGSSQ